MEMWADHRFSLAFCSSHAVRALAWVSPSVLEAKSLRADGRVAGSGQAPPPGCPLWASQCALIRRNSGLLGSFL